MVGKQFTWQQNKKGNPLFVEQKKTFLAHSSSEGQIVQRLHMPSDLQHQKENLSSSHRLLPELGNAQLTRQNFNAARQKKLTNMRRKKKKQTTT